MMNQLIVFAKILLINITGWYVLMIVQIFQILILYRSNLVKPFKKYYLKKQALNYNRTPYNAKLLQLELLYDLDNILLKGF